MNSGRASGKTYNMIMSIPKGSIITTLSEHDKEELENYIKLVRPNANLLVVFPEEMKKFQTTSYGEMSPEIRIRMENWQTQKMASDIQLNILKWSTLYGDIYPICEESWVVKGE